jgi:Leucine-rich repeat (LRR) protein
MVSLCLNPLDLKYNKKLSDNALENSWGESQVVELQRLDLSHNKISALSDQLGSLGSLTLLNVSHNQLKLLPPVLGK